MRLSAWALPAVPRRDRGACPPPGRSPYHDPITTRPSEAGDGDGLAGNGGAFPVTAASRPGPLRAGYGARPSLIEDENVPPPPSLLSTWIHPSGARPAPASALAPRPMARAGADRAASGGGSVAGRPRGVFYRFSAGQGSAVGRSLHTIRYGMSATPLFDQEARALPRAVVQRGGTAEGTIQVAAKRTELKEYPLHISG